MCYQKVCLPARSSGERHMYARCCVWRGADQPPRKLRTLCPRGTGGRPRLSQEPPTFAPPACSGGRHKRDVLAVPALAARVPRGASPMGTGGATDPHRREAGQGNTPGCRGGLQREATPQPNPPPLTTTPALLLPRCGCAGGRGRGGGRGGRRSARAEWASGSACRPGRPAGRPNALLPLAGPHIV